MISKLRGNYQAAVDMLFNLASDIEENFKYFYFLQ